MNNITFLTLITYCFICTINTIWYYKFTISTSYFLTHIYIHHIIRTITIITYLTCWMTSLTLIRYHIQYISSSTFTTCFLILTFLAIRYKISIILTSNYLINITILSITFTFTIYTFLTCLRAFNTFFSFSH